MSNPFMDSKYLKTLFPEILQGMTEFRERRFGRAEAQNFTKTANKWLNHMFAVEGRCSKFVEIKFYSGEFTHRGFIRVSNPYLIHLNISDAAFVWYEERDGLWCGLEETFFHELTHTMQYNFAHGNVRKIEKSDREIEYFDRWYEQEARFVSCYVTHARKFKNMR